MSVLRGSRRNRLNDERLELAPSTWSIDAFIMSALPSVRPAVLTAARLVRGVLKSSEGVADEQSRADTLQVQGVPPDVAICIPTCRRPVFLAHLLETLTALETDAVSFRTVIVDNDASRSAEPVVRSFSHRLPGMIYAV